MYEPLSALAIANPQCVTLLAVYGVGVIFCFIFLLAVATALKDNGRVTGKNVAGSLAFAMVWPWVVWELFK